MSLILFAVTLFLSAIFLVASTTKLLNGLEKSRKSLADFGVPKWFLGPASILLPTVEVSIAVLLFPAYSARFAALSALILLLAFNVAIAANLVMGKNPNCNCFGQLHSRPATWKTVARNSVLVALAGWLVWQIPLQPKFIWLHAVKGLWAELMESDS